MSPKHVKHRKMKKSRGHSRPSGPRVQASALPPPRATIGRWTAWLKNAAYVLGGLLMAAGLWIQLGRQKPWGLGFSALGALLLAAAYLDWFEISFPKKPAPTPQRPVKKGRASLKIPVVPIPAPMKGFLSHFTPGGVIRGVLLLTALGLGVMGQIYLSDNGRVPSMGLYYYFAGVVLFLGALWPWKREGLSQIPLAPWMEWGIFGLIMALAAFLRIYKLDTIPSGVFFDMGFQGLGALKVWRERWFPFELNITEGFPSAPVPIYLGSLWFLVFPNTQFCLNLFYVTMCLASFPLIYYTFRHLAGPRVALLTLFILAVMRWNINFARNSFPPSLLPFFMFGCLALLIYGLKTGKWKAFIWSAVSAAVGLYAYQTHVIFPLLVLVIMGYEVLSNWKTVRPHLKKLAAFWLVFASLAWPLYLPVLTGHLGTRQNQLSIFNRIKAEKSIQPLVINTKYTALMFNRRGDPNPRHNLQDYRQLDDVTGMLFFFGVFYALFGFWRRKYFWGLSGALIMALPCLLTIDPAHSSRMHGMTAFVAFLSAATLAAIWGRIRAFAGAVGEILFLLVLAVPLTFMALQNYHVYFEVMPKNMGCWGEYSIAESAIGRQCAAWGKKGDTCVVSPRYFCHYTLDYFTYFIKDRVERMTLPDALMPRRVDPKGGYFYGMEQGRTGLQASLAWAYPGGLLTDEKNPEGTPFVHFYRVPPVVVDMYRGLTAEYSTKPGAKIQAAEFPDGLPPGPYRAFFEGCWYADTTASYEFLGAPGTRLRWTVAGREMLSGESIQLAKGYYKVRIEWEAPSGATGIPLRIKRGKDITMLDASKFSRAFLNRGLLGLYYDNMGLDGKPRMEQWEPCVNFVNGNDFVLSHPALAARFVGVLKVPATGNYRFATRGCGSIGDIRIDDSFAGGNGIVGSVYLERGNHRIEARFPRPVNFPMAFSLCWIRPGTSDMEVISMEYFGETEPR